MENDLYLGLGSNLGDRPGNIRKALELLDEGLGRHYDRLSGIIETEALGFEGGRFLNCVVKYRTETGPQEVLDMCKRIERTMGRTGTPEYDEGGNRVYHDRPIDIDILLYGDEHINTEKLIVPHPRMFERDFVMIPLREVYDGKL